jgi:hypothetical protein
VVLVDPAEGPALLAIDLVKGYHVTIMVPGPAKPFSSREARRGRPQAGFDVLAWAHVVDAG